MDNPTKKTGVGPCVSLSPVSGGGPVQPWRRHPSTALDFAYPPRQTQPSWNVRGEQVMFTVTSPKHGTANHLNPPTPHDTTNSSPPPTTTPPSHLPSPSSIASDSQRHHSFSSIFKRYLFRGNRLKTNIICGGGRRAMGTGTAAATVGGGRRRGGEASIGKR